MPIQTSAAEAVRKIRKGCRIFIGSGAAVPTTLVQALCDNNEHFWDNELLHLLTLGGVEFTEPKFANHFRDNSYFIGANVRGAVQQGAADYSPIFLSEIPHMLQSDSYPIGAALACVSPPDAHGMCSLGVSVDIVKSALEHAEVKIAQINKSMPRTFGNSFFPYKEFDMVVESTTELPELVSPPIDPASNQIGKNIAQLIQDGSVLQMGIGSIPNAVLENLHQKNDLGVHTEMFSDGIIDLMNNGNINNKTKKVVNGRTLTSFCMGTRKLYDFVHQNPLIEFYPSDFTNDPYLMAKNDNLIGINSALAVDLTGQVCADSIGTHFYSGIGGQVDFIRGAARSKGGKPIIAFPSTAKGGTLSRICGQLAPGAGVVTSRGDVHYVVTEFGIANLHGKSIRERAMSLIQIAHPNFRDELFDFVKENKYVYFDQKFMEKGVNYPSHLERHLNFKRSELRVRPIKVSDERKVQNLFYSLDNTDLMSRFKHLPNSFGRKDIQKYVHLDYKQNMAFGLFQDGEFESRLVGYGHYAGGNSGKMAEVDFIVHKDYRGKGIGRFLYKELFNHAKDQGFTEIRALVMKKDAIMKNILLDLNDGAVLKREESEGDVDCYTISI